MHLHGATWDKTSESNSTHVIKYNFMRYKSAFNCITGLVPHKIVSYYLLYPNNPPRLYIVQYIDPESNSNVL